MVLGQVGKSTIIKSLVKHYTKHNLSDIKGPITIIAGKKRRLTFVECTNHLDVMVCAPNLSFLYSTHPREQGQRAIVPKARKFGGAMSLYSSEFLPTLTLSPRLVASS